MSLLETQSLTKEFGKFAAVYEVDYRVDEGEFVSLIGPNGAGKTTFFNLLTGEYAPTRGRIRFGGEDVTALEPHQRVNRGLSRVFQITNVFPQLTTFENVRLAVQSRRTPTSELFADAYADEEVVSRTEEILSEVGLRGRAGVEASSLPHGDKRRLEIGMALALEPVLLLLDEPTAGLPDAEVTELVAFLSDVAQRHTVLLVEHKLDVVMELSDRITVLHQGELIADGTVDEITRNERVQEIYIGGEVDA